MSSRSIKKTIHPGNSQNYLGSDTSSNQDLSDEDISINKYVTVTSYDELEDSNMLEMVCSSESTNQFTDSSCPSTTNPVIFIKVAPYVGPDHRHDDSDRATSAPENYELSVKEGTSPTDFERFSVDANIKEECELQEENECNVITRSKRKRKKNPKYDNDDIVVSDIDNIVVSDGDDILQSDDDMGESESDEENEYKRASRKKGRKRKAHEVLDDPQTYCYPCSYCGAKFKKNFHCRYHMKIVHSIKVENLPKVSRNSNNTNLPFQCEVCSARFKQKNYLKGHLKNMHSIIMDGTRPKPRHRCPICSEMCLKAEIHKHLEDEHDVFLNNKKLKFPSVDEFENWKLTEEKGTRSMYRQLRSCIQSGKRYIYYICHRSGDYISNSKGYRQMKVKGSNKINGYCPASITSVVNQEGECEVTYVPNHVGHDNDALYLPLSQDIKEIIAFKIAMNVPYKTILKEVKDYLSETDPERSRLLTRKDLYNISSSVFLQKFTNPTAEEIEDDIAEETDNIYIPKNELPCDYEDVIKIANQGSKL